jgi:formate dehydrogenase beta subunit
MSQAIFSSWNDKVLDARHDITKPITASDIGLSLSYEHHEVKAFISWNGLIIADETINVVALVNAYMQEVTRLACGECTMGYQGTRLIAEILQRLVKGNGQEEDLKMLQILAIGIQQNVRCDFCSEAMKPVIDSLKHYHTAFTNLIKNHEQLTQLDYITKITSPCTEACPVHQDIPGYIELVRNRRYTEALQVIHQTNCLPGVTGRTCVAFCEKNCVRSDTDKSLAIRALKRVPADIGIIKSAAPVKLVKRDKVAIIGAGPAGLSAARYLAQKGYRVTVFDEQPMAGGMVFAGIPEYRLPRKILSNETNAIQALGVEFKLNTRIKYLEDLTYSFKAVLAASGAHLSKDGGIKNWNKEYTGLMEGVKFLREINSGIKATSAEKVIIVGGGNTAIDCARTAMRLGSKDVTVVYRRSRNEMPARSDEVEAAEHEGIKFFFLALPVRIIAESSKVTGTECLRMELGEPDASGRRKPVMIKGSEFILPADLVLTAIGEAPEISFLPLGKVDMTSWNSIKVDADGRTSIPWLFAAGDCTSGPASIVEAMASGKRVAENIDLYLTKNKSPKPEGEAVDKLLHDIAMSRKRHGTKPAFEERQHPQELLLEDRKSGFSEVEQCFNMQTASREAKRCLRCYRIMLMVRK